MGTDVATVEGGRAPAVIVIGPPARLDPGFDRRSGIGASEIAAIAGLSPFATALDIYNMKVGITKPGPETPWQAMGHYLEPAIARWYADTKGVELEGDGAVTFRHPKYDFIFASPDRWLKGKPKGVQIKNVGWNMRRSWGQEADDVPLHVACQVTQEQAVMGWTEEDAVPLIGGNDPRIYTIAFDAELWESLLAIAERFWFEHVLKGVPPTMDGGKGGFAYLAAVHPRPTSKTVREATAQETMVAIAFAEARAAEKEWKKKKERLGQELRLMIGDDLGVKGETWKATTALQKESVVPSYVRKAGRVLRVSGSGLIGDDEEE